jgi:hypothetical protein
MTSQTITIRGTANECWFVDRISRDDIQTAWQAEADDWFDVLGARWIVAYSEVSPRPKVAYQFVVRCQPIVC